MEGGLARTEDSPPRGSGPAGSRRGIDRCRGINGWRGINGCRVVGRLVWLAEVGTDRGACVECVARLARFSRFARFTRRARRARFGSFARCGRRVLETDLGLGGERDGLRLAGLDLRLEGRKLQAEDLATDRLVWRLKGLRRNGLLLRLILAGEPADQPAGALHRCACPEQCLVVHTGDTGDLGSVGPAERRTT